MDVLFLNLCRVKLSVLVFEVWDLSETHANINVNYVVAKVQQ